VFAAAVVVVVTVTADVVVVVLLVQDVSSKDGTVTATIRKLNPNPTQNCLLFTFFSFFLFGMQSSIG
jgi:polyphosphate kinase 2 (PPK2 family)